MITNCRAMVTTNTEITVEFDPPLQIPAVSGRSAAVTAAKFYYRSGGLGANNTLAQAFYLCNDGTVGRAPASVFNIDVLGRITPEQVEQITAAARNQHVAALIAALDEEKNR